MGRREHFDMGHDNPNYSMPGRPGHEELRADVGVPEGMRECDTCGRVEESGMWPDWVNGECENCDPGVIHHPDNATPEGVTGTNMSALAKFGGVDPFGRVQEPKW